MKRKILLIILGVIVGFALLFYEHITLDKKSWAFIQSVGGIKIEKPIDTEDGYYLPVICDVSGLDSITAKPTMMNSALVCTEINISTSENKIYVTLVTGLAKFNKGYCICRATNIGELKPGHYEVFYKDETSDIHLIGQFDL